MLAPFVARVSVPKVVALLVCCAILMVGCIGMAVNAGDTDRMPRLMRQVIGIVGAAFAALSALGIGALLDLDRPLVEIGPEGLLWRRWSEQRIPWSAIKRASVRRHLAQSWITLSLHEPFRYPPLPLRRPLAVLSRGMGFGDITFSNQASDQSFDATVAAIRRFAPELTFEDQSLPNTAS